LNIDWLKREDADAAGLSEVRVLLEQKPAHYPEFQAFLEKELAGGDLFFRAKSGSVYRVGWHKGTDLSGLEICLRTEADQPTVAPERIDADLWPLMEWLIRGVGGDWTLDALRKTGLIYRAPGVPREQKA
jgi:hypothetical protein